MSPKILHHDFSQIPERKKIEQKKFFVIQLLSDRTRPDFLVFQIW